MDEESVKKLITLRSSLPHSIKEIPFLLKQKALGTRAESLDGT